ncbi:HDOD domain-containing protein [Propionivibrio sp.]|uniref:HDOD domain-containing protein n=1 Tax=Propionivibrio sp. TaxID=2212460 RepID=UPI003BF11CBE
MTKHAVMTPEIFSPTNDQNDQLEKVIASIDIPACPAVVMQAMAESQKDAPDLPRLAALIAADLSLSAATLKLANSALYRTGSPISGVRQAVERLGTKIVVSIVFSLASRPTNSTICASAWPWLLIEP